MAAPTPLDIANRALAALGIRAIIGSLTDPSDEAQVMSLHFDEARQAALAAHDWSFARRRATLTVPAGTATMAAGWTYAYPQPADCVQFRGIFNGFAWNQPPKVPFEVLTGFDTANPPNPVILIGTNVASPVGVYTFDNQAPATWSPQFQSALPYKLAFLAAFDLSADEELTQRIQKRADMLIEAAWQVDQRSLANEARTQFMPEWLKAR